MLLLCLRRNGEKIYGDTLFEHDSIELCQSFFRGPNYVIWHCHQPDSMMLSDCTIADLFELEVSTGYGNILYIIDLRLNSITWNYDLNCLDYHLIPLLWHYMREPMGNTWSGVKNIEDIIKQELVGSVFDINVADEANAIQLYNGYTKNVSLADFISNFCRDNQMEFYISDVSVGIGYLSYNPYTPKYYEIKVKNNIYSEVQHYTMNVITVTTSDVPLYPGCLINIHGDILKIVYLFIRFSNERGVESTIICIEEGKSIDEETFNNILPQMHRSYVKQYIPPQAYYFYANDTEAPNYYERKGSMIHLSNDMFNPAGIMSLQTPRFVQSSPYAGSGQGIQFPYIKEVNGVAVAVDGDMSASVVVGQLYTSGDTIPKRDDEEDFRLTLPDGGTMYYSKVSGSWIICPKSQITIGYQTGVKYNEVPSLTDNFIKISGNKVMIKSDNVYLGDTGASNKVTLDDHKHKYDKVMSVVCASFGSPCEITEVSTDTTTGDSNSSNVYAKK